jgi:hypothetical protein
LAISSYCRLGNYRFTKKEAFYSKSFGVYRERNVLHRDAVRGLPRNPNFPEIALTPVRSYVRLRADRVWSNIRANPRVGRSMPRPATHSCRARSVTSTAAATSAAVPFSLISFARRGQPGGHNRNDRLDIASTCKVGPSGDGPGVPRNRGSARVRLCRQRQSRTSRSRTLIEPAAIRSSSSVPGGTGDSMPRRP